MESSADPARDFYSHHGRVSQDEFVEETFYADPAQRERLARTVDLIPPGVGSLLDVGAGFGVLLHEIAQRRDLTLEGVEMSDSCIQWGLRRGLSLQAGTADKLPYPDHTFDVVACCETLEHLPWGVYEAALEELPRVAREWILVTVPFDERRNFARCPYCGTMANPNYHLRSFAPEDFGKPLFKGFELETLTPIGEISSLTVFKSYLPAPWHPQMVCPACNYRSQSSQARRRSARNARLKALLRALPFPRRPRWMGALYRRR